MNRDKVSPETLGKLMSYDPETGKLFWLERTVDMFSDTVNRTKEQTCPIWNGRFAGKEAFTAYDGNGYRMGLVFRTSFRAHLVCWALHYGRWPDHQIDHINGIRDDNRISNLRDVPQSENGKNQKLPSHNTSGTIGVYVSPTSGKWCAAIRVGRHKKHLGTFESHDEAVMARAMAAADHQFHQNHGRA
jgi:hypothetical protein